MRKLLLLLFLLGCPDKTANTTPSATASPPSATTPPTVSASADPPATASASASTSPSASASVSTDGGAMACGTKPLPDCPLQKWMKANTSAAMSASDFDGLATALDKVVTFAPPGGGYPNWASISKDGAKAARAADMTGVKASCRGCHDQYKAKYKTEIRTRPISG